MAYPVNPVGFNPMFQAAMPNDYTNPTNFGSYGGNPNQSGWGLNTSYLTPSFLAPYRPQYSGNANFQMPTMGFGRALNTAIPSPFQPDTPYYANPQMYQARGMSEAGNKVSDSFMAAGQFAIPVAIGLAISAAVDSYRFSGGAQADVSRMAYGFRSSMPSWLGGANTLSQARYLAESQTLMEAGGHALGRGAGRVIGLVTHGVLQGASFLTRGKFLGGLRDAPLAGEMLGASRLGAFGARAAGFAGAAAGSLLAPLALGEAIASGVDSAVFSPYVAGRQTGNMVQDSLRGTYTELGSPASPLDVTNINASGLGFELSRTFTNNMSFGMEASADIYSGATSAGLFKGTNFNTGDMKKRMKDVTQSISLMMSVFNDPSTQDAIERLRQLSEGAGLKSVAGISALSAQYRIASAVTGMGTRELMSGIGTQGQLMYAQSGLMPHLGQYAALNAMTGISSAYRSGLVSSTSLAMMGGEQGATQLALQAQIGLARNPYFEMTAFNKYAGKGMGSDMVSNIANFGQSMASNPLSSYGNFMLNKDVTTSSMLRDNPRSIIDRVIERGKTMPGFYTSTGKIDANSFASIAMSQGLSPDQIRALYAQIQGEAKANAGGAAAATYETSRASWLDRQGLTYYGTGIGLSNIPYEIKKTYKKIQDYGSRNIVGPWGEAWANVTDSLTNIVHGMSNNAGTFEGSSYTYDNEAILNAMGKNDRGSYLGGVTDILKRFNYNSDIARGPSSEVLANVASIEALKATDPKLVPSGVNPSNDSLRPLMKQLGITDVSQARAAVVALNTRKGGDTTTSNLYERYSKSAANTMNIASFYQFKTVTDGKIGYEKLRYATNEERATLQVFSKRHNAELTDPNSFLGAVEDEPYIKGLLTKLGFGEAFTGSGPSADAKAKEAMDFIRATIGASSTSNRDAGILETAADLATGEGKIRSLNSTEISAKLKEATKIVSQTQTKSYGIKADIASAMDSPGEFVGQRSEQIAQRDKIGKRVGDTESLFDFSGLQQASDTQKTAANTMLLAAQIISLSSDKSSDTSGTRASKLSALQTQAANLNGQ